MSPPHRSLLLPAGQVPSTAPPVLQPTLLDLGRGATLVELAYPAMPVGWVVVPRLDRSGTVEALDGESLALLQSLGLGTAVVHLTSASADVRLAAASLRGATRWLKDEDLTQGLPVSYLGVGLGASAALIAAADTPQVAAVLLWNAQLRQVWRDLSRVSAPTLFMLNAQQPRWERWSTALARHRLAARSDLVVASDRHLPLERLAEWYNQHAVAPPARRRVSPGMEWRRAAAAAALALALAAPALGGPVALAADPAPAAVSASGASLSAELDFDSGLTLGAAAVKGDGFDSALAPHRSRLRPTIAQPTSRGHDDFADGITIGGHDVRGDGVQRKGKTGKPKPFHRQTTGSQALIDAAGVKYFINTDITFSTSSSASGAMSEASFTHAVPASTLNGGTVASTLNDAFDGYNTVCISVNNTVTTCETANPNFLIYNKNGPASLECNGRQVVFPPKTFGNLTLQRKVFVPANDTFARWLNIVTNNSATPQTVTLVVANNLGSDSNTRIVTSSNGDAAAQTSDTWLTTFQNYSGTTSSDPRLGHVFQGPGAPVPLAGINFANGDDNPYWGYTLTLQPGQTAILMDFVVVQPSKAAAATKASQLANLPATALQCLSAAEQAEIVNFRLVPPNLGLGGGTVGGYGEPASAADLLAPWAGGGAALLSVTLAAFAARRRQLASLLRRRK